MSIHTCLLCGGTPLQGVLCPGCWADLPRPGPRCRVCAEPLGSGTLCGRCAWRLPPYAATYVGLRYGFPVDRLINDLKFHDRLEVAGVLAATIAEAARIREAPWPSALIPVPMHRQRLGARGYNQAAEIARLLGAQLRLPVRLDVCTKIRATDPQLGLNAGARRRNLRGAFRVVGSLPGARLALVDDVMTTGATLGELARTLRAAGAERIELWIGARA